MPCIGSQRQDQFPIFAPVVNLILTRFHEPFGLIFDSFALYFTGGPPRTRAGTVIIFGVTEIPNDPF
jgi:hypothetical protein